MRNWRSGVTAAGLLAALAPTLVTGQTVEAAIESAERSAFDERAAQLVDLFTGRIAYAEYFTPLFQDAVPEAQFKAITASLSAQYGQAVAIDDASSNDGRTGTVSMRFEKGVATIALTVGSGADGRVSGLRITNVDG